MCEGFLDKLEQASVLGGANGFSHVWLACGGIILWGMCIQTLIQSCGVLFLALWIGTRTDGFMLVNIVLRAGNNGYQLVVQLWSGNRNREMGSCFCSVLPGKWTGYLFIRAKIIWGFVIWLPLFPVHTPLPSLYLTLFLLVHFFFFFSWFLNVFRQDPEA